MALIYYHETHGKHENRSPIHLPAEYTEDTESSETRQLPREIRLDWSVSSVHSVGENPVAWFSCLSCSSW